MDLLDTNVLVRHFTGDPPDQARRATRALASAAPHDLLYLDVHVAETVFVLEGPYRQTAPAVAGFILSVMGLAAVDIEHPERVARALALYAGVGLDYADAYLVAAAEERRAPGVLSFDRFDRKLGRASPVRRREP